MHDLIIDDAAGHAAAGARSGADEALHETACLLCASRAGDPLISAGDARRGLFHIVRCRHCGLAYTSPRPSPHAMAHYYPDDYSPHQPRHQTARVRRSAFAAYLPAKPGRLLDFGCGAGDFLQQMRACGWQVTGIDNSPRAARHVRDTLGLPALDGSLPHPDLSPGSFDAVTMAESLEHVHDPLAVLRAGWDLLTPGGRVVISVPNLDSLAFRWFGADWIGLDLPRHLTHFTPRSLRMMLTYAGFRVERLWPIHHNSWLRHSAERVRGLAGLLRYRLPASLAGWYSAARMRSNGILAVGVRS